MKAYLNDEKTPAEPRHLYYVLWGLKAINSCSIPLWGSMDELLGRLHDLTGSVIMCLWRCQSGLLMFPRLFVGKETMGRRVFVPGWPLGCH